MSDREVPATSWAVWAWQAYRDGRLVEAKSIKELEAENKLLNEQMDAIEEMGTESLNALPDCLMRLAPALVENEELKAKLTVVVETLQTIDDVIEAKSELFSSDLDLLDNLQDRIRTTLAAVAEPHELKGQDDER